MNDLENLNEINKINKNKMNELYSTNNKITKYKTHIIMENSNYIFKHLSCFINIIEKHNLKYWIMYGTLLGAIRQQDIIQYDHDFDIGINYKDLDLLNNINDNYLIKESDYTVTKAYGGIFNITNFKDCQKKWRVSYKINYKGKAVGDIYVYKEFKDGYMRRYDTKDKIYFWPNTIFPSICVKYLEKLNIRDKVFYAPSYSLYLIEHWYGPDWKTPFRAESQEGESHFDYDYYGNYKHSNISLLVDKINKNIKMNNNSNINNNINLINMPNAELIHNEFIVNFIYPLDMIIYLKELEKYNLNKSTVKQLKKRKLLLSK